MMQEILRRYATPISLVAFVVIGLTGTLMFFGVRGHQLNEIHEWVGISFVVIAILHVVRNTKAFMIMLRQKRSVVTIAVLGIVAAVFVGTALAAIGTEGPNPRRVQAMLTAQLANAPIAKLAPALNMTGDQAVARLKAGGITVTSDSQTLSAVAEASHQPSAQLFQLLLDGQRGHRGGQNRH